MADTPDYGAMVLGGQDGGVYTGQHGLDKEAILRLIRQYGDTSALAPDTANSFGITGQDLAGVNDNPYSTVKNLAKTLVSHNYGITNNANAHHAEFSGAHQAQLIHEGYNADQRRYDAGQTLGAGIAGVQQTDLTAYGNSIQHIMDNYVAPVASAPAAAPEAPAPAAPAVDPSAPAPGVPTNMQGTPVTFGPAGPGDKSRAPAYLAPPKPKIPVGIHAQ